ncbi:MAG: HAD family phosphatase [Candidatus Saccharibacteria bacterium]
MIKAIIFDFYGVISSDEYHDWLDRHGFERGGELKNLSKEMDMGVTSIDQFFESLSKLSNIPSTDIRQEFLAFSSLNEELLAKILELKKKYKIALLSNASSSHLRDLMIKAGIDVLFDQIIISSEVGHIKPSKKIFEYALSKLDVKPNEAVFIDDNESFCNAASELGIESVTYRGYKSLLSNFKEMGIMDN